MERESKEENSNILFDEVELFKDMLISLPLPDIFSCMLVCKDWHFYATCDHVWKNRYQSDWRKWKQEKDEKTTWLQFYKQNYFDILTIQLDAITPLPPLVKQEQDLWSFPQNVPENTKVNMELTVRYGAPLPLPFTWKNDYSSSVTMVFSLSPEFDAERDMDQLIKSLKIMKATSQFHVNQATEEQIAIDNVTFHLQEPHVLYATYFYDTDKSEQLPTSEYKIGKKKKSKKKKLTAVDCFLSLTKEHWKQKASKNYLYNLQIYRVYKLAKKLKRARKKAKKYRKSVTTNFSITWRSIFSEVNWDQFERLGVMDNPPYFYGEEESDYFMTFIKFVQGFEKVIIAGRDGSMGILDFHGMVPWMELSGAFDDNYRKDQKMVAAEILNDMKLSEEKK